jgi:hypothetical protein
MDLTVSEREIGRPCSTPQIKYAYRKSQRKKSLDRPNHIWKDNIKMEGEAVA